MARVPVPTWFFALVVVRLGHRFLLMKEKKYGQAWSIPGGRVELGESLADGAMREVHEESGIRIQLDGIYRFEHTPGATGARVRVIFAGTPVDDTRPKTTADHESLGAAWLTLTEIRQRELIGADLLALFESISAGRQLFPLDLLGRELSV